MNPASIVRLRVNLGKRGVSVSEGIRGANVTLGTRGVRMSLGLPGTGFGWYTQSRWPRGRRAPGASSTEQPQSRSTAGAIIWTVIVVGALALLGW